MANTTEKALKAAKQLLDGSQPKDIHGALMVIETALDAIQASAKAQPVDDHEFTDSARSALLHVLWHHQGFNSPVGQPIRFALGMGRSDRLSDEQISEAKRYGDIAALAQPAKEPDNGEFISVTVRLPKAGQRIQGLSRSGAWIETFDPDEPLGLMTHWRAVDDEANDATEQPEYNGEEWELLAMELAEEEHDDIHQLLWTGGPIPEPWGEVWQKYEDDAKRMIRMVRKCTSSQPSAPVAQADLNSIEQYRLQMAGISTAALGYWKESDSIHPDYDTPALRDVARLYAKYAELHKAQAERHVLTDGEIVSIIDAAKIMCVHPSAATTLDIARAIERHFLSPAPQVEQVEAKEGWISVKDRMPGIVGDDEDGIPCLVARCEDGQYNICIDVWLGTCWAAHEDNLEHYYAVGGPGTRPRLPSYWMPLPAAPASQNEGEQSK